VYREGGREVVEVKQRKGERGNSSQSWVENTNMTAAKSLLRSIF
jgi:hypothetical protein